MERRSACCLLLVVLLLFVLAMFQVFSNILLHPSPLKCS